MAMTTLQWPDYLILVLFLVISLGIGFYHSMTGGRQRTVQEFIMANRSLGILPTALSLFVSFQSAIMILSCTAEMYMFGVQYLVWIPVSFTISTILVERLLVPWIYPLKLVSINDVSRPISNMYLNLQQFVRRMTRAAFVGDCKSMVRRFLLAVRLPVESWRETVTALNKSVILGSDIELGHSVTE